MDGKQIGTSADPDVTLMTELGEQETPAFRKLTFRRIKRMLRQTKRAMRRSGRRFNEIIDEVFHFNGVALSARRFLRRYLWTHIGHCSGPDIQWRRTQLLTALGL